MANIQHVENKNMNLWQYWENISGNVMVGVNIVGGIGDGVIWGFGVSLEFWQV